MIKFVHITVVTEPSGTTVIYALDDKGAVWSKRGNSGSPGAWIAHPMPESEDEDVPIVNYPFV